jgi:hypothetical protein
MRILKLSGFIVFAVLALALASVAPAAAQGGTSSEPCGTGAPVQTRPDGSFSPPRFFVPPVLDDLRLGFRLAFARVLALSGPATRTLDFSIPADLPARRRSH